MILLTKLIPPKFKDDFLPRARLVSYIRKNLNRRFILICADAGYGKTTILSELLTNFPFPYFYYQIDEKDRDLAVFLNYLSSGISNINRDFTTRAVENYQQTRNLESSATILINDIVDKIGRPIYFIFDDYHHLAESREINQFMDFILCFGPEFLHFIISTRIRPPFTLTKLIARQEFLEIDRRDMMFDRDEIEKLFKKIAGITLSGEEVNRLKEYSEGWITALRLVIQNLLTQNEKNTDTVLNNYLHSGETIFNYFTKEILARQKPQIRDFLLRSSILDQMDQKNCHFLLGIKNPDAILTYLERNHLFVSYLDAGIYQYHRLFREFLKKQLTNQYGAQAVRHLHYRAGIYYEKKGDLIQAIEHFIAGEKYLNALNALRRFLNRLMAAGMFAMLYNWLERLPIRTLKDNPDLYLSKAKILRHWGRWDDALAILDEVYMCCKKGRNKKICVLTLNEMGMIYHYRGNVDRALRIEKQASRLAPKNDYLLLTKIYHSISVIFQAMGRLSLAEKYMIEAWRVAQKISDSQANIHIACGLAFIYSVRGEFQKAMEILSRIIKEYENEGPVLPWMGNVYGNATAIALDLGRLDEARIYLERAEEICRKFNDRRSLTYLLGTRGQFYLSKGDYKQAISYYERAIEANRSLKERRIDFAARIDLASTYLALGDRVRANKFYEQAKLFVNLKTDNIDLLNLTIIKGQIEESNQNLTGAIVSYRKALKIARFLKVPYFEFRSLFYLSRALIKRNDRSRARRLVNECLDIAESKSYDFLLMKEYKNDATFLEFAYNQKINFNYVESLIKEVEGVDFSTKRDGLVIKFFGGLEIFKTNGKKLVVNWPTQKTKSLFCYFVLHPGKRFTKEQLTEIFWPGWYKNKGEQNLYTNISFIRKIFQQILGFKIINHSREFYYLNPAFKYASDFEKFEQIMKKAKGETESEYRIEYYLQGLDLRQEEFLPEIYDPWCETIRNYIKQEYNEGLNNLGRIFFEKKDYKRSCEYFERSLKIDPFNEEIHCYVMKCYKALGLDKKMIDHYKQLLLIFEKELGRAPGAEIIRVYNELIGK
ncbi:MAG: tetratricopeptide repeat protein [candidate division WOR-3 bacterium]